MSEGGSQIKPPDARLKELKLPLSPEALLQEITKWKREFGRKRFVRTRDAKQARECWIGCKFLLHYAEMRKTSFLITQISDSPDLHCQDAVAGHRFAIEAAEVVVEDSSSLKRFTEDGREISGQEMDTAVAHFRQAVGRLLKRKKLANYGPNCFLVMYVNLDLYDENIVRDFATCDCDNSAKFSEIWLLYNDKVFSLDKVPGTF